MARIEICDFCKEKLTSPSKLSIKPSAGDKIVADICEGCANDLIATIKSEIIPRRSPVTREQTKIKTTKTVPQKISTCAHEQTSFEPPNTIKCKQCGEILHC